jgi:hypothetical protein
LALQYSGAARTVLSPSGVAASFVMSVEKLAHIGQRMTLKASSLIMMSAPNDEIFAQPFGLVDMSSKTNCNPTCRH